MKNRSVLERVRRALIAAAVSIGSLCNGQTTLPSDYEGEIHGRVTHSLRGTKILALVRVVGVGARPWTSPERTAAPDGTFQIKGIPPGDYIICARIPNRDVVDPCFWGAGVSGRAVPLGSRQKSIGNLVELESGRKLEVLVRDPQKLLTEKVGSARRQYVHLTIAGPDTGRPVILQSSRPEPDGQAYEVVFPSKGVTRVRLHSKGLQVRDLTGRDVVGDGVSPVDTVLSGPSVSGEAARIEFQITGRSTR